ncbi:HPr family phosphocarrier protein [Shewanella sp. SR43-4]|jgi:phosphocarrier protein NPr|uniref:HPr family phosphocarrier protein n=1 Tax=Shewanella vesiculosa TaxID=518738 RepID=A0ABV0FVX0_9GAMM|nr:MULTISPECIES: HPr family phosphocarrier protein [Shewanella]NCQ45329.1 HPr family phosphocarrier protein [Shewanella frigidimarina]MBB1316225.1 HPr family phosphocarrier protein [Shewanella sp. SR43-4]MBB1320977.1 HPr family phosphocarrier protein [Shewanella sp. SR43-8]MBB1391369.1 HPr family phosphocarrier protein [Shewanella sp. SG44-6]MBB1475365.1 HPr family phosphocarrier protein [Shewanella sp. SG41-3]|tara:strand:+ start:4491 stop:4766 length:276 start_codon:yes stop_codon:yes gene_type:complete
MIKLERQVTISNKLGLHARAATKLAVLAGDFDASITLTQGDKNASAASVLGLLMLESGIGKMITVTAQGPDAEVALNAVCDLINAKFDESC